MDCDDPDCKDSPGVCRQIFQDPGIIRFGRNGGLDVFHGQGIIEAAGETIDATSQEVFLLLTNDDGVIYKASLIPGDLTPNSSGRLLDFVDRGAKKGNGKRWGVESLRMIYRSRTDRWSFRFRVFADMSAATTPDMRLQLQIGSNGFISEQPWTQTTRGWRTRFRVLQ